MDEFNIDFEKIFQRGSKTLFTLVLCDLLAPYGTPGPLTALWKTMFERKKGFVKTSSKFLIRKKSHV